MNEEKAWGVQTFSSSLISKDLSTDHSIKKELATDYWASYKDLDVKGYDQKRGRRPSYHPKEAKYKTRTYCTKEAET